MSTNAHASRLLLFAEGASPARTERQAKIRRYRLARLQLNARRASEATAPRYAHLKRAHD